MKSFFLVLILLPAAEQSTMLPLLVEETVGDLEAGESGWITKYAVEIDKEKKIWIDLQKPVRQVDDLFYAKSLLWVEKREDGYKVTLPKDNYERCKSYFSWQPVDRDRTGWQAVMEFSIKPEKEQR